MSPPRSLRAAGRALLCACAALGCAGPQPAPGQRVAATPSTLALAGVVAAPETPLGEPGPGRVLVYRAITGHVPFRELTPEGVVYRARTPGEEERAAAAQLEEELRHAREREELATGAEDPELTLSERLAAADPIRRLLDENPLAPPRRAPEAPRAEPLLDATRARPVTIPAGSLGNPTALRVLEESLDQDGDGRSEELRFFDQRSGQLLRRVRDEDGDRRADVWDVFEAGVLQESARDTDADGRANVFDLYAKGQLASRRIDLEGDGSVESQYHYSGSALAEERHDGNGDGAVDLVVYYEGGTRLRSEEDRDLDGRADTWTHWRAAPEGERLLRIERDLQGRGRPDAIEHYELLYGQAVLTRVEEDRDGDGKIDAVQRYEMGERVEGPPLPAPPDALKPL